MKSTFGDLEVQLTARFARGVGGRTRLRLEGKDSIRTPDDKRKPRVRYVDDGNVKRRGIPYRNVRPELGNQARHVSFPRDHHDELRIWYRVGEDE